MSHSIYPSSYVQYQDIQLLITCLPAQAEVSRVIHPSTPPPIISDPLPTYVTTTSSGGLHWLTEQHWDGSFFGSSTPSASVQSQPLLHRTNAFAWFQPAQHGAYKRVHSNIPSPSPWRAWIESYYAELGSSATYEYGRTQMIATYYVKYVHITHGHEGPSAPQSDSSAFHGQQPRIQGGVGRGRGRAAQPTIRFSWLPPFQAGAPEHKRALVDVMASGSVTPSVSKCS